MTGQQPGPRMVPAAEARKWLLFVTGNEVPGGFPDGLPTMAEVGHTAAVLGEQRDAVLKLSAEWDRDDAALHGQCFYAKEVLRIYGVTEVQP